LIGSIICLFGLDLPVPDHSTLRGRAEALERSRPRFDAHTESVQRLVDSTELKFCGAGEWLIKKYGTRTRRSWRKLHIGMDAETGEIVADALATNDVDDASEVSLLLSQVAGPVASFTGAGAYDQDGVYRAVADHQREAVVIVPPRSTAVPGGRW
jgi:hypothetical protein